MNSVSLNIVIVALGSVVILVASDSLLTLLNKGGFAARSSRAEAEPEELLKPVALESAADGGYADNEQGTIAA